MESAIKQQAASSFAKKISIALVVLAFLGSLYFAVMYSFFGQLTPPTRADFARVALRHQPVVQAIYRYKEKNGVFPQQLKDLTPDFLASLPIEPDLSYDGVTLLIHANAPHTAICYSFRHEDEGWFVGGDFCPGRLDVPKPAP